jgi:hypothetical protein
MIEGAAEESIGWTASLTSAKKYYADIEREMEARTRRGEAEHLNGLVKQRAAATN